MPVESKPSVQAPQVSFRFKDSIVDETRNFAADMGIVVNNQVVRFPKLLDQDETVQRGVFRSRDFLVVDVPKIKKLAAADKFAQRDRFSRGLLRRLGFMPENSFVSQRMTGVDGNLLVEFGHESLPYKAEALVHNMGHKQYLISGFVISPK